MEIVDPIMQEALKRGGIDFSKDNVYDAVGRPDLKPSANEYMCGFAHLDLVSLRKHAEEMAGLWNGDESGLAEDRAHCATEVIEKIDELLPLLEELGNY